MDDGSDSTDVDAADAGDPNREDQQARADANRDATWGDPSARRSFVPGFLTGDVGPKGQVSAQLRDLSRSERSRYGEVPRGTNVPGTGRYVLLPLLGTALLVLVLLVLLGWWLAR